MTKFGAETRQGEGGIWVVRISGEVDMATAPRLNTTFEAIIESGASRVLVELENVSFLDSSGIRSLLLARKHLEEIGATLVIDGMSDSIRHVLEIAGVLDQLANPD